MDEMGGILGKPQAIELATIPQVNKELDRSSACMDTAREAARATG
jgi:hypothetical protein